MPCFTPMIVSSQSECYFLNTKPGRSLNLTGSFSKTQQLHFTRPELFWNQFEKRQISTRVSSPLICSFLEINMLTDFSWLVWRIFAALPLEKDFLYVFICQHSHYRRSAETRHLETNTNGTIYHSRKCKKKPNLGYLYRVFKASHTS